MKVETQATAELSLVAKLVEDMTVAMLTAVGDDGALTSRPMAPLKMDETGAIWFFTDIRSEKLERLRQVNIAFSDEGRSTYVSLAGHGEVDTDRGRIESLWTPMAKPWFPEGPHSTNLALLRFVPHTGEYWDAPGSRMVRLVTMAVSAVAGKPVGMGDHGTLDDLSSPPTAARSAALPDASAAR